MPATWDRPGTSATLRYAEVVRASSLASFVVAAAVAMGAFVSGCARPAAKSAVPTRKATLACPRGAFATELDALMPRLLPPQTFELVPATILDKSVEPGCIVPFRREPDERLLDAGRIEVFLGVRAEPNKASKRVGRGDLTVGRGALRLSVHDDAGDETMSLVVTGAHVALKLRGADPYDADVHLDDDQPLPLPLDALVASLSPCDTDERTGKTVDGNQIEAKRGAFPLFRGRFLDTQATMAIDTSVMCGADDARLAWRTATGDTLPFLLLASARAPRTLLIRRQAASVTDPAADPGMVAH